MLAKCVLHTQGGGSPKNIILNLDAIAAFYPGSAGITKLILTGIPDEIEIDYDFDDFTAQLLKYKMGNITPSDFELDSNNRVIPKLMKFY
jgi:hypothetical protein